MGLRFNSNALNDSETILPKSREIANLIARYSGVIGRKVFNIHSRLCQSAMRLGRSTTKLAYLVPALALLGVSIIGIVAYASQVGLQTQAADSLRAVPLLSLNQLNASTAKLYGIHGVLDVGSASKGGQSITATPGELISLTLKLSYTSFDSTFSWASASFQPAPGQTVAGGLDVSAYESYSPSTSTVYSNQPVFVTLTFQVPSNANPQTFRLLPSGLTVSPAGIAVVMENDVEVVIL